MPGLTLNTEGAAVSRTPIYPPAPLTSQSVAASSTTNTTTPATSAVTTSAPTNPNPNPNTNTNTNPSAHTPARPSSPQRPPYSPITPPLNPIALPPRPAYTHSAQRPQTTGVAPPAPEPIDFDANPDVLALKSAISVLQLQRRKAEADMAALSRVKAAALADPRAFVRDLTEGRVGMEGAGGEGGGEGPASSDSDSDEDSDEDMDGADADADEKASASAAGGQHAPSGASSNQPDTSANPHIKPDSGVKPEPSTSSSTAATSRRTKPQPSPWARLPKPQNIVRCPPINWSQYAVVGESLDKLHAEQVSRPTQGVPAVVAADGRYEFGAATGKQERLVGIAAPYAPGKDRIDRRSKGPRR
ncbi:uncharacterized protein F4807DRAFT_135483 [Annulohypoxylon truncatum]|uniref:uncharacterized protein n=1 Tax=Annulohypoxylon truncatum TaxID=327061 RepID=UPI002007FF9D|nr:uncharacterized protein F4807DRAFT_135483 [Annulohypoxylon truncatum]KAI1208833.1 hypothetical protein F4807DRAFT_135483 [Annulohypoxylon truncatum]